MMNQFAQLLSAEKQTLILLDTCTVISALQQKTEAVAFRKKIAKRKDIRIVVPRILIGEVTRVARISYEAALALIESFSEMGQIDYVDDLDGKARREADALTAKYPQFCHFPNSLYLVYCREHGALLVTYDNHLRKVAKMEGIMTCAPGNFRIY